MRFALLSLSLAALLPLAAYAAESIDSFSSVITIRPDSSIRVSERIVYDFGTAEKHGIFRDIPLSYTTADGREGRLSIAAISVADETGAAYPFSLSKENGAQRIKIGDPDFTVTGEKTYVISYDVANALAPYDSFDELYWNVTGNDWQVPIGQNSATVILPAKVPAGDLRTSCYWGPKGAANICGITVNGDGERVISVVFSGLPLKPQEGLTVAIGFPKGLATFPPPVPWWKAYPFSLIALGALVLAVAFALYTVRSDARLGRGTIVPQYEPPQGIKPAQADVLVHGKISKRTWPATIVDLAVRQHVRITEESTTPRWRKAFDGVLVALLVGGVLGIVLAASSISDFIAMAVVFGILLLFFVLLAKAFSAQWFPTDYVLTKIPNDAPMEEYERKLLDILFANGDFSTKKMRKDVSASRALFTKMTALESDLYKETASDTNAYALGPDVARKRLKGFFALGFLAILAAVIFPQMFDANDLFVTLGQRYLDLTSAFGTLVIAAFVAAYPVYMRPRLNREGSVEREEWLGFKLYLSKAEQYRLQNLTPATFEKFLPYAMVFGIEKKWAKAFEGLNVPPPNWYRGASTTSFSPAIFAGSFGSSFSSSFASSGGGGASGGGGSSGGGGGGGGGGSW